MSNVASSPTAFPVILLSVPKVAGDISIASFLSITSSSSKMSSDTVQLEKLCAPLSQHRQLTETVLPSPCFITSTVQSPSLIGNTTLSQSSSSATKLLKSIASGCVSSLNEKQPHQQRNNIYTADSRTLQLALELSMVGQIDSVEVTPNTAAAPVESATATTMRQNLRNLQSFHQQQQQDHYQHQQQQRNTFYQQQQAQYDFNTLSAAVSAVAATAKNGNNSNNIGQPACSSALPTVGLVPPVEERSKKSQNMTECVPVPSSEHVAEIVGRQGCKIKALRAKTNTYIKTPVRGEEPVFVVTGRKEDVTKARREILSAAEHFTLIRATRKTSFDNILTCAGSGSNNVCGKTTPGPPPIAGQLTIQVRVPYRVVGLVVGPKGATIKHIQQDTQTYIVTPSREKEPIFEVTGLPDNVQSARKQIEAHIALRTGSMSTSSDIGPSLTASTVDDVISVHTINTLSQILNNEVNPDFLASIYKNGICSAFGYIDGAGRKTSGIASPNTVMELKLSNGISTGAKSQILQLESMDSCNRFQLHQNMRTTQNNGYLKSVMGKYSSIRNRGSDIESFGSGSTHLAHSLVHVHESHIDSNNITFNDGISPAINTLNLTAPGNSGGGGFSLNGMTRSCSSASSTTSSKSANNSGSGDSSSHSSRPELMNIWKNLSDSLDIDEGIGESQSIWTNLSTSSLAALTSSSSHCSPSSTSISPTDSLLSDILVSATTGVISKNNNNLLLHRQQQQQLTSLVQTHINMSGMRQVFDLQR